MKITVKAPEAAGAAKDRPSFSDEQFQEWRGFFRMLAEVTQQPGFLDCIPENVYRAGSFDIDTSKFARQSRDVQVGEGKKKSVEDGAIDITDAKLTRAFHDRLLSHGSHLAGYTSLRPQISSLAQLMENLETKPIGALKNLEAALGNFVYKRYETNGSEADFFVVRSGQLPQPMKISTIKYHEADRDNPAKIEIIYYWYNMCDGHVFSYQPSQMKKIAYSQELHGKNLQQWLADQGWLPSTPELVAEQKAVEDRAAEIVRTLNYKQIRLDSSAIIARGYAGWGRPEEAKDTVENLDDGNGRAVVDLLQSNKKAWEAGQLDNFKHPEKANGLLTCSIPIFHLKHLKHVNVPVQIIKEYRWVENIKEKLVLPPGTQVLLDTLTADPEMAVDDIVTDKQSSSAVLLMGVPGVGKTLSAEVYAEENKQPLYKVSSGHLGTTPEAVKKNLQAVCIRANRWKCSILLDECDVFVRARGFDINQNAIVIAFLEALEYTSNLIWMTTNRGLEIDDAIISRCIAIVRYNVPTLEERRKLWPILTEQFFPRLAKQADWKQLSQQLAERYDRVSGRDIKMVLILALRYDNKHGQSLTWDVEGFNQLVEFRRNPNNDLEREKEIVFQSQTGFK